MINFMKYRYLFFGISCFVLGFGFYFIFNHGLPRSIDFVGGSLMKLEIKNSDANAEKITNELKKVYEVSEIKKLDNDIYEVTGSNLSNDEKEVALNMLKQVYSDTSLLSFDTVGPAISQELATKTMTALALVAAIITFYVARQFNELKFGIAAILAMLHDSLILLGAFSFFGFYFGVKIDILFVTALLTTLSFSVHDTIVVFDRIRELKRKNVAKDLAEIINLAISETLTRSLNNSLTIIFMLTALVLLGGETIKWFAVALLVGAVTGTYSSTFTAVPLLLLFDDLAKKFNLKHLFRFFE